MRIFKILLCLSLVLIGCRPNPDDPAQSPVVVFSGSGFSIEPGPGWIRLNTSKLSRPIPQVICQPALSTQGATIQVAQIGDRAAESAIMANVSTAFAGDELAIKDSLKTVDFQADSGVRGKLVRYARHTAPDPTRVLNHLSQYIVRTAGGRWISIGALTDTDEKTAEVEAMIKRTLREIPPSTPTPRPK